MNSSVFGILVGMFTGALIGYLWGWIWGWSLFDPNLDLWALLAGTLAILGMALGAIGSIREKATCVISSTIGLYLGWIVRTLAFGDIPGGPGILFLIVGVLLGTGVSRLSRLRHMAASIVLTAALYAGFFGGFLVDFILLRVLFHQSQYQTIPGQAPAILFCGVIGGWIAARLAGKSFLPSIGPNS
jgi:hypothetical protein